jgi:hypothetical protein
LLAGIEPVPWQDTQYVLRQFGPTENEARRRYLEYVAKTAGLGCRPELVGGVVERRLSGWRQVGKIKRKRMKRAKGDRRILGDSGFIEKVVSEVERCWRPPGPKPGRLPARTRPPRETSWVSGSRRRWPPETRWFIWPRISPGRQRSMRVARCAGRPAVEGREGLQGFVHREKIEQGRLLEHDAHFLVETCVPGDGRETGPPRRSQA